MVGGFLAPQPDLPLEIAAFTEKRHWHANCMGGGVIPSSIRSSTPTVAISSPSNRPKDSARIERQRDEEAAAHPGLAGFGGYLALWMQPSATSVSPTPPAVAHRASPRTPRPASVERARPPQFERSRAPEAAYRAPRTVEANRREGTVRRRDEPTASRSAIRSGAAAATASSRPGGRSSAQQAHEASAAEFSKDVKPFAARESAIETHRAAEGQSGQESRLAGKGLPPPANEIENQRHELNKRVGPDEGTDQEAPALTDGSGEGATPVAADARPAENPVAAGSGSPATPNPIAEGAMSGMAAAQARFSSENPAAGRHVTVPPSENGSTANAAGYGTDPGNGLAQDSPDRAGAGVSAESPRADGGASKGTAEAVAGVNGAKAQGSGAAPALPSIRVTVDHGKASAETSANDGGSSLETTGNRGYVIDGAEYVARPGWTNAHRSFAAPPSLTANLHSSGVQAEVVHEPLPGARIDSPVAGGTADPATGPERTAAPGTTPISSTGATAATITGEDETFPSQAAREAGEEATVENAVESARKPSAAASLSHARGRGGEGLPSRMEASRRMTIPAATHTDASSASMAEEDSFDSPRESAPWLARQSSAGVAGFAHDPEFLPALSVARLSGHATTAAASVEATSRAGVHSSHARSSTTLPGLAEALLAEVPSQPGSASGKDVPTARALRVDIPGASGGEDIRLRFLHRGNLSAGGAGADIDVRIESPSERIVREMRAEIPSLLHRLERAGFDAGNATPGHGMEDRGERRDASSHRQGGGASGQSGGQGFTGGHSSEHGDGNQRSQPFPARVISRRLDASSFAENVTHALARRAEAEPGGHRRQGAGEGPGE